MVNNALLLQSQQLSLCNLFNLVYTLKAISIFVGKVRLVNNYKFEKLPRLSLNCNYTSVFCDVKFLVKDLSGKKPRKCMWIYSKEICDIQSFSNHQFIWMAKYCQRIFEWCVHWTSFSAWIDFNRFLGKFKKSGSFIWSWFFKLLRSQIEHMQQVLKKN